MDSIGPAPCGKEIQHGSEVGCGFLEACGEPSHVLHAAEEAFDDVAGSVEVWVKGVGFRALLFEGMTASAPSSAICCLILLLP